MPLGNISAEVLAIAAAAQRAAYHENQNLTAFETLNQLLGLESASAASQWKMPAFMFPVNFGTQELLVPRLIGDPEHYWSEFWGLSGGYFESGLAGAFAAQQGGTLVVAFRGSNDPPDGFPVVDIVTAAVDVEAQLRSLWYFIERVIAYVNAPGSTVTDLVITGHSLGGELAELFASLYLPRILGVGLTADHVSLISFGSPGVPNELQNIDVTGDGVIERPNPPLEYDIIVGSLQSGLGARSVALGNGEDPVFQHTGGAVNLTLLGFDPVAGTITASIMDNAQGQFNARDNEITTNADEHSYQLYYQIWTDIATAGWYDTWTASGLASPITLRSDVPGIFDGADDTYVIDAAYAGYPWLGLAGSDTITISAAAAASDTFFVTGGTGNDVLTGAGSHDYLDGAGGGDSLAGHGGDDFLWGGAGTDYLEGGADNDTMVGGGAGDFYSVGLSQGQDTINDQGGGQDVIRFYSGSTFSHIDPAWFSIAPNGRDLLIRATDSLGAIVLNLTIQDMVTNAGRVEAFHLYAGAGSVLTEQVNLTDVWISLGEPETPQPDLTAPSSPGSSAIELTDNIDAWTGDSSGETVWGRAGADQLNGSGGDDTIFGGAGHDILDGGDGDDDFLGDDDTIQAGNDVIHGRGGNDNAFGLGGDDDLYGEDGNDALVGGDGADELYSGTGIDWLDGGAGSDVATIDLSTWNLDMTFVASAAASAEGFTFRNGTHVRNTERVVLTFGSGNDIAQINLANRSVSYALNGGSGFDRLIVDLTGVVGESVASVSFGSVQLGLAGSQHYLVTYSGFEAFTVYGSEAQDAFYQGGAYDDYYWGNGGADGLIGGGGDDYLNGGNDGDWLQPGAGADVVDGGAGADTLQYRDSTSRVTVDLLNGTASGGYADGDTFTSIEYLEGSAFNDQLYGDNALNILYGRGGDDQIYGRGGNDSLVGDLFPGDTGDDFLDGGAGNDTMTGNTGNDTFVVDQAGDIVIENPNEGIDRVLSSITYTLGSDVENLTLTGSAALNGTGNGLDNAIVGNSGGNSLTGGAGTDSIDGGAGIDTSNYFGASTSCTWMRHADGTWTVTAGADGVDTLRAVEMLHFSDRDVHLDAASRTFSGDGTSDILFRRNDGIMASWEVTGTTINSAAFLPAAGAEWTPLDSGDFNGDGRADVLWRRNDGLIYSWEMNGGSVAATHALAGIGAEWSFLGAGDFNGDTTDDLAWQRNDGIVYIWQMGAGAIQSASVVAGLGPEWQMQGVGDFNSDGRDDFLWRRSDTGEMVIWNMNGAAIAGAGYTSLQIGLDWSVAGVGDTNGDGRDDIILQRDSNGTVRVWSMDNATVSASANVGTASPAQWTLHNIGDYNGDGRDDILWQRADGAVYVWLLNGTSIIGSGALSGIGAEWDIIGGG